jgi:hypothetical protein
VLLVHMLSHPIAIGLNGIAALHTYDAGFRVRLIVIMQAYTSKFSQLSRYLFG